MIIPESYRGREQTYIKHELLAAYLERLFMIIGLFQPVIRYVDCFSGPWNEKDDNLQDTSIGISLKIMEDVKAYWLSKLSLQPRSFGTEQLADMIEETGWFESDFQEAFHELAQEGVVANLDDTTNRRRKKFVHFDAVHSKGEQLMRLKP